MDTKLAGDMKKETFQAEQAEYEAPPPMYSNVIDPSTKESQTYPPQSHHKQTPSRSLQVDYSSWLKSSFRVTDVQDTNTILYEGDGKVRKPHLSIKSVSPSAKTDVAIVNFHLLSCDIDVVIQGNPVTIKSKGFLNRSFTYSSPINNSAPLKWRSKSCWKSLDFVCEDENEVVLAKISPSIFGLKKAGTIEIFGPMANDSAYVDEMVVFGLAMLQYMLIQIGQIAAV